jgi:hypothetical protein
MWVMMTKMHTRNDINKNNNYVNFCLGKCNLKEVVIRIVATADGNNAGVVVKDAFEDRLTIVKSSPKLILPFHIS